jgi:hypothetical protein
MSRTFCMSVLALLASCATYHEQWKLNGACSVVCDYRQGYISTAYTVDPYICLCGTPQLASFNEGRMLSLDHPYVEVRCERRGGCAAEAIEIVSRQPWRAP